MQLILLLPSLNNVVPFIIDSIQKGKNLSSSSNVDLNHSTISNGESTSQETGVMLALFSVGLLVGSPILGFLGKLIYFF